MFRTRFKTLITGLSISLMLMALAFASAGQAFATDPCLGIPDCVSITAGTLTHPAVALSLTSDQFTLNGTDVSTPLVSGVSAGPLIQVVDATGSGLGWNVTASDTVFTDGSSHNLTNASISINWGTKGNSATHFVSCAGSDTCTLPADTTGHATTDNAGLCDLTGTGTNPSTLITLSGTGQLVCNAQPGTGLGTINLDPTITFSLPANVYSSGVTLDGTETFTTTITITAGQTPA